MIRPRRDIDDLDDTLFDRDEADGNAGAPTVLCAYGADDADVLAACEIEGQFVPLRIPRSVSNRSPRRGINYRQVGDRP